MRHRKSDEDLNCKYRNAPYVLLGRVSDNAEVKDSDKAQKSYLKNWAAGQGMILAPEGEYVTNDLSGSIPGNRADLRALIQRADEKGDFKYILAQRIDRATRGGAEHLLWFECELRKRGVTVLYPGHGIPEGIPFQNTVKAAMADAAKEQAFSTSQRSAQGAQYALENRKISPHSKTPYGTYRLYCRDENTPLFAIHDLRNGQQHKLSWPDLEVIDTYGQLGGGSVGHYRKQKSELVYLVPGDPNEVEVVRDIFRMHYIEGFGTRRIARILNQRGIRAARGGKWAQGQVESLVYNEDYTGRGIANRKSSAIYHRRRTARPEPVEADPKILYNVSRIKPVVRPIEDWFESEEPYMAGFLGDEHLRQVAIDRQTKHWKRRLDPTWTRKNKKRYSMSPYLLTDILAAKQDGEKLVGSRCGKMTSPKRIYRHRRGQREAGRGNIFGRVLDADTLEAAVLAVLQEILLDWPAIESSLQHHVQHHLRAAEQGDEIFSTKQREREEANDQLRLLVRMLSPKTQRDLAPELARWEAKRDLLDAEIATLQAQQKVSTLDPEKIVLSVRDRLRNLAGEINLLPPHAIKLVLAALTESLLVNMETKEVEFVFRLPTWAILAENRELIQMCMSTSSGSSTGTGTHPDSIQTFILGDGTCRYGRIGKRIACHCSRRDRLRIAA